MPQAPEYLREDFEDDQAAFKVIDEHFEADNKGIIRPRTANHETTPEENRALDYLWMEWDYVFKGFKCI